MTYSRKKSSRGGYPITEHYRDGKCFAITEGKRIHSHWSEPKLDIHGRKHRLQNFSKWVECGRHDVACYIYHIT